MIVVAVALVMVVGFVGIGLATWATVAFVRDNGSSGSNAQPPAPSGTAEMPASPPDLARFYEQKLDWSACGANQCARLRVPLDYAEPEGRVIRLAVLRAPAQQRSERVGQLVVNPGGPGGSGVDYAASGPFTFGDELTRYYDIVGFDPRGVGRSTPLTCGDTRQTDEFLAADPDPDEPSEAATLDRLTRAYGEACLDNSGELARHMSTVEVAKDMDVLRAALGERQLDYLGASYGTLLGATYADLFPTHVRRMVLDGAIDPALTNEQISLGQAGGFQVAFNAYLEDCVKQGSCPLGDTVEAGAARIAELLDQIDATPLPTSGDRQLTEGLATYGIFLPLYLKEYWPLLTAALQQAIDQGNGDRLLALSDQYTDRGAGPLHQQLHGRAVRRELPRPQRLDPGRPGAEALPRLREGRADLRPGLRLRPLDVLVVAGQERQHDHRAGREGCAAHRGGRHHAGPGDAVRLGQVAGRRAGLRPPDHPRRRRAHRLPSGQPVRGRRDRGLPGEGDRPEGRPLLLTCPADLSCWASRSGRFGGVGACTPILVRRARLTGRALRRLSSVGRASHS